MRKSLLRPPKCNHRSSSVPSPQRIRRCSCSMSLDPYARRFVFLLTMVCLTCFGAPASAATLYQAPLGGAALPIPAGNLLCGSSSDSGSWSFKRGERQVVPPPLTATDEIGRAATTAIAKSLYDCTARGETLQLVAVGPLPKVEAKSIAIYLDEGRLELAGRHLEGLQIQWAIGGHVGEGTCLVTIDAKSQRETCAIALSKGLSASPDTVQLRAILPGSTGDESAMLFDGNARVVPTRDLELTPARLVISRLVDAHRVIDLSQGSAIVPVYHAEAIASVDCAPAQCELAEQGVAIRTASGVGSELVFRPKLIPRVYLANVDELTTAPALPLKVAFCPMTVISGPALRDVDDSRIALRLDSECGKRAAAMSFVVNDSRAEVERVDSPLDTTYVVLRTGRLSGSLARIQARRATTDAALVAVAETPLVDPPLILTTLSLPGYGPVDFIPTNRTAVLTIQGDGSGKQLIPISVRGVYEVSFKGDSYHIRGVAASGGYVPLRFALRGDGLPDVFSKLNLATLVDPVQRLLREANVPTPLTSGGSSRSPVIELMCVGSTNRLISIPAGSEVRIPFEHRDSCRVVIHRRRIPEEDGEQQLEVSARLVAVSGTTRSAGEISQQLHLRHSVDDLSFFLHGVEDHYDRFVVRVSHIVDESLFSAKSRRGFAATVAQWTVIVESAWARFYATAAIPTSLFRFSGDPEGLGTGPLNLNFGLLSRLTWLTSSGKEGIVGLESGVMAMGLSTANDRQLNLVAGIGLGVPIANANQSTQASINVHAWAAYRIGSKQRERGDGTSIELSPWAFIFGPSITIGSVGTNL